MIIERLGEPYAATRAWWDGIRFQCPNCNTVAKLEATDRINYVDIARPFIACPNSKCDELIYLDRQGVARDFRGEVITP